MGVATDAPERGVKGSASFGLLNAAWCVGEDGFFAGRKSYTPWIVLERPRTNYFSEADWKFQLGFGKGGG